MKLFKKGGGLPFWVMVMLVVLIFGGLLIYWVSGDLKDMMVGLFARLD